MKNMLTRIYLSNTQQYKQCLYMKPQRASFHDTENETEACVPLS